MAGIHLPVELWMKVMECLPINDLYTTLPLVCWDMRGAAMDDSLWKRLYNAHFHVVILAHREKYSGTEKWRHNYEERKNMVSAKGLVEFTELLKTLLKDPYSFVRNDVMKLYTTVFHFCISNFRVRDYGTTHLGLYQLLVDCCAAQLDEVCKEASNIQPGERLLEYYIDLWSLFQNTIKRCNVIFAYFQRDYQSRKNQDDMFERMVNTYVANTNWKSNVVLGITPMMVVTWLKRFFNPLQQALMQSIELSTPSPTVKKAVACFIDLVQMSQCKTFPKELCMDLMTKLGYLVEVEDGAETVVVGAEGPGGIVDWLPNAGVAVQ